ncbi:MAG: hemerythrin domain-containing protein [Planctomycetes bacterium]|nr:hemerythrin domain-containing protein [Planctomycetota bacterium]
MNDHNIRGSHRGAHPADDLEHEHTLILRVLDAAAAELTRVEAGAPLRDGYWHKYVDFLGRYADEFHHGKEEVVLFAALQTQGMVATSGPISRMRSEHDETRGLNARLAEALTSDDTAMITHLVLRSIDSLRMHIAWENEVLLPVARETLDIQVWDMVRRGFDTALTAMGPGFADRYVATAEELCSDSPQASPA